MSSRVATCRQCGREYRPQRFTSRLCSFACWNAWEKARSEEKRGTCRVCHVTLPRKRTVFCSHRCRGISMTKPKQLELPRSRRKGSPKTCVRCGKQYFAPPSSVGRRWCSKACYNLDHPAKYDEANCQECGILFRRRPANMHQRKDGLKFCSLPCSRAYFRGDRSPAWRGGSNPNRGTGWLKRAEEARQRDEFRCRRCGKTQDENGERLSVDHLIPWRTFDSAEQANQLDNLVSLCRPCHTTKTQVAEHRWLKGDVLAMQRHIEAITLPSAAR